MQKDLWFLCGIVWPLHYLHHWGSDANASYSAGWPRSTGHMWHSSVGHMSIFLTGCWPIWEYPNHSAGWICSVISQQIESVCRITFFTNIKYFRIGALVTTYFSISIRCSGSQVNFNCSLLDLIWYWDSCSILGISVVTLLYCLLHCW
jgi:hypothetical protein